jgi:hypothetical protein
MCARNDVERRAERGPTRGCLCRDVDGGLAAAEAMRCIRKLRHDIFGERVHLQSVPPEPLQLGLALQDLFFFEAISLYMSGFKRVSVHFRVSGTGDHTGSIGKLRRDGNKRNIKCTEPEVVKTIVQKTSQ